MIDMCKVIPAYSFCSFCLLPFVLVCCAEEFDTDAKLNGLMKKKNDLTCLGVRYVAIRYGMRHVRNSRSQGHVLGEVRCVDTLLSLYDDIVCTHAAKVNIIKCLQLSAL